ncbi:MAG TPA: hypothetical protein VN877_06630 [Opitutaceae bacterium]|nr:hypothetical protein [Opitutaceae bacterium]
MCFLRSEGREAEAREIEDNELAAAVVDARRESESDAEADALLNTLRAEAEERVADAIAFAEVLMPMLAERLRPFAQAGSREPENARQRKPNPDKSGEPRGIADFIDDMLAQDRAGSR